LKGVLIMALSGVSLTLSARQNLLALQDTSSALASTQERLATGKKINSATDGATAFFASRGFLNRASDLSRVKEGLSTALQTVKAASNAVENLTKLVEQLQGVTTAALQSSDTAVRSGLATQYNTLRSQVNALVNDAVFNGKNLLNGTANVLAVYFNEDNTSSLTITGVNVNAAGLAVTVAASSFSSDANVNASVSELTTALTTLRTSASNFGVSFNIIQARQDFASSLINTLQTASDNLVLADINEEGANLQALQARSQLGVVSLGISGQQAQAILRLF
jgi:flagellin